MPYVLVVKDPPEIIRNESFMANPLLLTYQLQINLYVFFRFGV